jgi:uncharacterized UPF0160 family protein
MPIKVGTLLNNLAKKVGYNTDTPAFAELLSANLELPDDLVSSLESRLFTEDAAKNNGALKAYFFKQALDGVDNNVTRLIDEFQLDDERKNEILGIKSTYDRVPALVKTIQSLEAAKAGASKGDKAALQDQINKLNEEKATLVKDRDAEIKKMKAQYEQDFTDNLIKTRIASANLVVEQFDKPVMEEFAYKFFNQELAAVDAKVVQRNGVLKLVKASDEALDFYADNKPVTFPEFLDSTLAKHKLIAVNKPAPPPGTPPNTPPNGPNPPARPANSSFAALIAQSQADLQRT